MRRTVVIGLWIVLTVTAWSVAMVGGAIIAMPELLLIAGVVTRPAETSIATDPSPPRDGVEGLAGRMED